MRKLAILVGSSALLVSCQTPPPPPPPPEAAPMIDPNNPLFAPGFMAQAASGDQFEIQSSQLALQMSSNPAVRNFANMLIADHARMSQALAAAATAAGLTPPAPALLPAQQSMLDQLRTTGPNFDAAFRGVQIGAHQQALQLMQNYAASGDVPVLRNTAQQAIPIIQSHLSQAQMLSVATAPPPPPPSPVRQPGERG
jgi:putative membrane protein